MPERPLILFPKYESAEKARRYGGPSHYHRPSHSRQIERLSPQFSALQHSLDNNFMVTQTDENTEPEYTLVLEVAGDPAAFDVAIRNLQSDHEGVEWIFELVDEDGENNPDFFRTKNDGTIDSDKKMSYKYFCVLANQRALSEILSLWNNFTQNVDYTFPKGKTGLRNVFQTLVDIHMWGPSERLEETGILDAWVEDLKDPSLENVHCEIELFFRKNLEKRATAQQTVEASILNAGGKVITCSCIEEIEYHAILAHIPRDCAENILNNVAVEIVNLEQIMFFKPTGQSIIQNSTDSTSFTGQVTFPDHISSDTIIALFDGLPQENHPLLANLISIDDPQNFASEYQSSNRLHGTSMASLILHGNLDGYSETISHKIYVRPIMKPYSVSSSDTQEFIPPDSLIVDIIHQAVLRLFEETAGKAAPQVRIINLSIGIGDRLFYNMISPLAKLLDWLSFKYRVLFIVSAGNHSEDINLGVSFSDYNSFSNTEKNSQVIRILNREARNLKLLSPAESINSLTVGALFKDNSCFTSNYRQLLPCENGATSLISSMGCGINRSIKPDIVFDGGRNVLLEDYLNSNYAHWRKGANHPPGILSAKPLSLKDTSPAVGYSFGTSDSAAQITHNAALCYDVLNEIFNEEMNTQIPHDYAALLIKSMLVHGATWGDFSDVIRTTLSLPGRAADEIHRWLGYGYPDISRVKECAKNRITLIGYGEIKQDKAHLFELPLPFGFHTGRIFRRLTITLASFTPVNPATQKYRSSQLWFTIDDGGKNLFPNRVDASDKAVARGTIQHEHFVGEQVVIWDENDLIKIKINCREDANNSTESVPYSLFCTFEIAPELDLDVYQKVIDKIHVKDPVTP